MNLIKLSIITLLLLFISHLRGQSISEVRDSIYNEGYALYEIEKAAWLGSDILTSDYKEISRDVRGYLSYKDGAYLRCIFYDNSDPVNTILEIRFDSTFSDQAIQIDTALREMNDYEFQLKKMRENGIARASNDTIFKHYKNTNLNFIPIIDNVTNNKRVYVLTGPQVNGVVVLGNDYLIELNDSNVVVSAKTLHKNIIPINYGKDEVEQTMHTHLESTGEYITSTDICTLLLYGPYVDWVTHTVVSKNYWSLWSMKNQSLIIMKREAIEMISKDQKKKKKRKKQ